MNDSFADHLATGRVTEGVIANWVRSRGNSVLPVYEKEIDEGKGPQFFSPDEELVAPDMLVFPAAPSGGSANARTGSIIWLEAKHKTVFTWHRISQRWTTGIDFHHFESYLRVQELSARPVWLLFYHSSATPNPRDVPPNEHGGGCPDECPTGLFGRSLSELAENINHKSDRHGRHGMIYWHVDKLIKLATLDEVEVA